MPAIDVDAARAILQAMTPGEWVAWQSQPFSISCDTGPEKSMLHGPQMVSYGLNNMIGFATGDARGIAYIRNTYSAVLDEIVALRAERDHWKANHDNQVVQKRIATKRPDLPYERSRVAGEVEARINELMQKLEALRGERDSESRWAKQYMDEALRYKAIAGRLAEAAQQACPVLSGWGQAHERNMLVAAIAEYQQAVKGDG